jgi:hypothetical protein
MGNSDTRTQGNGALGVAYLQATLTRRTYPIEETRAHLAKILEDYGDPETARWDTGFDNMMTWALSWAARDAKQLADAGEPVPAVEAWRKRVHAFATTTDCLLNFSAWHALLDDPKDVPTPKELRTAEANDPASFNAMRTKVWAAYQIKNELRLASVYEFDRLTEDLRNGAPGLYETNFDTPAARKLIARINEGFEVTGTYVHAGNEAWDAMRVQQDAWSAITKSAKTAALGSQRYGSESPGHASTSSTGGRTPSSIAVRLRRLFSD